MSMHAMQAAAIAPFEPWPGFIFDDYPADVQALVRKVIEARRAMEYRVFQNNDPYYYFNLGDRLEESLHYYREERREFARKSEYDIRERKDERRDNMRRAFRSIMRARGLRENLRPGISVADTKSDYTSTKNDYFLGMNFFDMKYTPRETLHITDISVFALDDAIDIALWKVRPERDPKIEAHKQYQEIEKDCRFMACNLFPGEGSYDRMVVPYKVLLDCQLLSEIALSKMGETNPIYKWLHKDVDTVREAFRRLEAKDRAEQELRDRETFKVLLHKFGPAMLASPDAFKRSEKVDFAVRYLYSHYQVEHDFKYPPEPEPAKAKKKKKAKA